MRKPTSEQKFTERSHCFLVERSGPLQEENLLMRKNSFCKVHRHRWHSCRIQDPVTGRVFDYTAVDSGSKHSQIRCYYVFVNSTKALSSPQIGRILSLFEHQFGKKTYMWAIVEIYSEPSQDEEFKLWNVTEHCPTQVCCSSYTSVLLFSCSGRDL